MRAASYCLQGWWSRLSIRKPALPMLLLQSRQAARPACGLSTATVSLQPLCEQLSRGKSHTAYASCALLHMFVLPGNAGGAGTGRRRRWCCRRRRRRTAAVGPQRPADRVARPARVPTGLSPSTAALAVIVLDSSRFIGHTSGTAAFSTLAGMLVHICCACLTCV